MADDELDLIRRARDGDVAAVGALYGRHWPAIVNYFSYRLRDVTTAEDLASDVFVRMVGNLDAYRDRGRPLLAWLYTIARHRLADHLRHNGYAAEPLPRDLPSSDGDPVAVTERAFVAEGLVSALARLTEQQRMVIVGRIIEGRSSSEMAAIMGRSEGSVKALQHRALGALRRALEREQVR